MITTANKDYILLFFYLPSGTDQNQTLVRRQKETSIRHRYFNVRFTSYFGRRRRDQNLTLIRRYFNVMCLLGWPYTAGTWSCQGRYMVVNRRRHWSINYTFLTVLIYSCLAHLFTYLYVCSIINRGDSSPVQIML